MALNTRRLLSLSLLFCACVATGVFFQLGFVFMAQAMPVYVEFLLYAPAMVYTALYFTCHLMTRRKSDGPLLPSSEILQHFFFASVLMGVYSILQQFADPYLTGSLQTLMSQLLLPLVLGFSRVFLKHKLHWLELVGACVVVGGAVVVVIPAGLAPSSTWTNDPFWVVTYGLSAFPQAALIVYQEWLFTGKHQVPIFSFLAWVNLFCDGWFLASAPLAFIPYFGDRRSQDFWSDQADSWRCFFMTPDRPVPPDCFNMAWFPVLLFVVAYLAYFYVSAIVVARESAAFQAATQVLVTPITALVFGWEQFVQLFPNGASAYVALNGYSIGSIFLITFGIVIMKLPEVLGLKVDVQINSVSGDTSTTPLHSDKKPLLAD